MAEDNISNDNVGNGESTDSSESVLDILNDVSDVLNTTIPNLDDYKEETPTHDLGKDLYSFENKSDYCNNCENDMGVEIDGFLFFPEEISGGNTYSNREFIRTKIMSGGEFVSRGQYTPREFNFKTTLTLDPNEPYYYDKVFQIMENKHCQIISPYMGDNFKAEVQINKTHPKSSPSSLVLDVNVKEIVKPKASLVGDSELEYPSTTTLSKDAVEIKINSQATPTPDEDEQAKITQDWKARANNGEEYHSPY